MTEKVLAVIAIDLGTSFSGYGFQTRVDFKNNPNRICVPNWYYGDTNLAMGKTTTSILFRPDEAFHSFGYEAERKFADLFTEHANPDSQSGDDKRNENDDPTQWYFFKHFKMQLYDDKCISNRMRIADYFGKKLRAVKVFSAAIQFMKDKAMKEFKIALGDEVEESDFKWVVTVPAIWGDKAKQFMRTAAEVAGIPHSQLVLAIEPEAAAFFCKEYITSLDVVSDRRGGEAATFNKDEKQMRKDSCSHATLELKPFDEGCSFLVVDCGGGTVDITTFCIEDGAMKELQQASGGDVGGEIVTQRFLDIWNNILGEEKMTELQSKYPTEFLDFHNSFQALKQSLNHTQRRELIISLPFCILENIHGTSFSVESGRIEIERGKARISISVISELFEDPINKIVQNVERQLNDIRAEKVTDILMVGGFSNCTQLCNKISDVFEKYRVIRPLECDLSVLKGAVMLGFKPDSIRERISRFSYGISSSQPFDKEKHTGEECMKHRVTFNCQERIEDLFAVFVKTGEAVVPGLTSITKECRMLASTGLDEIDVYISNRTTPPMFIYSFLGDCKKLGIVKIYSNDRNKRDRYYDVTMSFGYTELRVSVKDKTTNQQVHAVLDMLGQ